MGILFPWHIISTIAWDSLLIVRSHNTNFYCDGHTELNYVAWLAHGVSKGVAWLAQGLSKSALA